MDKNSVTGFILIAVILFGFTFYQSRQSRKAAALRAQQDSIALAASPLRPLPYRAKLKSPSIRMQPLNLPTMPKPPW